MDLSVSIKIALPLNRVLPYLAVFRTDLAQTLKSGLYRACGLVALMLCMGLILHRSAIHNEAKLLQNTSTLVSELMQMSLWIGTTIVIILCAGTIATERDVLAETILSRGVSRWQYFLGKWHARWLAILGGFALLTGLVVAVCLLLLKNDLHPQGLLFAFGLVACLLTVVITFGIVISSWVDSNVLAIALMWIAIYGLGALLYYLPIGTFDLPRLIRSIPELIRGQYDPVLLYRLMGGLLLGSVCLAMIGIMGFSRRDL